MDNKLTLPVIIAATGGSLWASPATGAGASFTTPYTSPVAPDSDSTSTNPGSDSQGALTFDRFVYDSREVTPGAFFVALPGEVTDGHNFIKSALAGGATGCLVRQDWVAQQSELDPGVAWVVVPETLGAFQKLTAYWRNQFSDLTVIGVTGSVGKTSTKELMAAVLGQQFQVFKTPKSINTEQSILPILLKLQASDQVAVVEMGAGYELGELRRLCGVAQPRIGVVLNVSHSHIGRMGSLENIALNKSELVQSLPPATQGGVAVLNGDDFRVKGMANVTTARIFYYGLEPSYDLYASEVEGLGLDGIRFKVHYAGQTRTLALPLLGKHSVHTALAAIAVALLCGMDWPEIEQGLQDRGAQVRLVLLPGANGSTIIDDCYNASAVSTLAALELLKDIKLSPEGRRLAVLGDMLELGDFEQEAHFQVGRKAVEVVDAFVVVGPLATLAGEEALRQGMPSEKVIFADSKAGAAEWLRENLQPHDYVLIKASRGSRLEEIVEKVRAAN
ncbi:MAG: UDP-N-acetylmuramoyl-tripeptide--D-alanyl-D-alanine ligase [Chloroflexi bacterium]|nr:UDP-N-acetylmuramoyl-tripeptide--D-alanyl-D-alanine ligase [Chloroflexota bacterium]